METSVDVNCVAVPEEDAKRAEELKNKANDYFKGAVKPRLCHPETLHYRNISSHYSRKVLH